MAKRLFDDSRHRQMADLDPDQCLLLDERVVLAEMRIAQPAALRINAMLIPERTRKDKDFLATIMSV